MNNSTSFSKKIPPTSSVRGNFPDSSGSIIGFVRPNASPRTPKTLGQAGFQSLKLISRNYSKSPTCRGDMEDYKLDFECHMFLNSLQMSPSAIDSLQKRTIGQSDNGLWKEERRKRLTASNFGRIFCMRDSTSRKCLLEKLLGLNDFSSFAMQCGTSNEPRAIAAYEKLKKQTVDPCGFFVHPKFGYLGASPDGLIGDDGLLEVKCPSSANRPYLQKVDGEWRLKPHHQYFYQVQGQLEVTGRKFCDFVVWTSRKGIEHIERIFRDESVWDKIFPKLEIFYKLSLLPELVDPRSPRYLSFREPDFVVEAIDELSNRRKSASEPSNKKNKFITEFFQKRKKIAPRKLASSFLY